MVGDMNVSRSHCLSQGLLRAIHALSSVASITPFIHMCNITVLMCRNVAMEFPALCEGRVSRCLPHGTAWVRVPRCLVQRLHVPCKVWDCLRW